MALTVGSLFSGIGGIDLGLERAGMVTRWFVEIDPHCRNVLARHWPGLPIYGDITAIDWTGVEPVDVLAGGFPCQPVSNAGKRLGTEDERWLWPEFARAIRTLAPRYVLVENVAALLGRGFGEVITDLAALGYDAEWDCIPAAAVGAPHLRDRLWIVAHATGRSRPDRARFTGRPPLVGSVPRADGRSEHGGSAERGSIVRPPATEREASLADADAIGRHGRTGNRWALGRTESSDGRDVPDTDQHEHQGDSHAERGPSSSVVLADTPRLRRREGWPESARQQGRSDAAQRGVPHAVLSGLEGHERGVVALSEYRRSNADSAGSGWWSAEPDVGRVADGIPHRVDRLRSLGNAVVPQVVEWIGRRIVAFDAEREAVA